MTAASVAVAQNPTPSSTFIDVNPGYSKLAGYPGVVVKGLDYDCGFAESQIGYYTVDWLENYYPVWTEISIYNTPECPATIQDYKNEVAYLVSYVESSNPSFLADGWLGIMVDEEQDYGFSTSDLETLNAYIQQEMQSTVGVAWWATENDTYSWSQSTFDTITSSSVAADQISSSYMVSLVNGLGYGGNLVTWTTSGVSYPWTSESYDDGQINGTPFLWQENSSYWDNEFEP